MSLVSGLRSGVRSALRSGLDPSDGATWSLDATSGKALPATSAEAAALLAAAGISANTLGLYLFGAPASGDVTDASGNGKTLTAAGTLAYQQTVTGWAAKSIDTNGSAAGTMQNSTFSNVNASTPTIICYAQLGAIGATRTILRMGDLFDDDCCFEQTITPRIQGGEGDATRTTGGSDPTGQVRPFALSCGASVILASDQESIAVGTKAAAGTNLLFGGDNVQTNLPGASKYVLGWVLDAALSSAQIKTLLQTAGWTIPW